MNKILVAIDESKVSETVLEKAKKIATMFESEVLVVTAIQKLAPSHYYRFGADFTHYDLVNAQAEDNAKKLLAHAKEVLKSIPGKCTTQVVHGNPADVILEMTEIKEPALLIMGSRGLGGFKRAMLGSVSTKVLHHATCDVMIIKDQ